MSNKWIKMDVYFFESDKLKEISKYLNISTDEAGICVLKLWCYTFKHWGDGVIKGGTQKIAEASQFKGNAMDWYRALITVGIIEHSGNDLIVSGWSKNYKNYEFDRKKLNNMFRKNFEKVEENNRVIETRRASDNSDYMEVLYGSKK